ncbi:YD repeat-containing protein [Andreprevotia lacus DSM 23236]|jgi:hypothetical protein|uniref:YD repeat-containing protein n=1 Tax=Andreprevotia lacus DSM 23236 TaxID=1121001 RepID=A0A1W1Y0A6_9NEIS|nr:hypothetical protein [Andreprevotia lacus]SMC29650.1 YD repeat-containing protein [Andreprevotia lacus DSM 23236]
MTGGSKLLGNLLRDYAGVRYDYDSRGNLSTRRRRVWKSQEMGYKISRNIDCRWIAG